ncbi:MAG: suppressor of fused domain protein [Arcobacter sp.]|nr:suppressor of fused domain protein [Arcobacter sp.]
MNLEEYKKRFDEDDAVGWDCIDEAVNELYPNQEPKHYGTMLKYRLGGDDPLDGVSIYKSTKGQEHYHLVSYGMSQLYYDEESVGGEFSKWGFEFTFRLAPFKDDKGEDPIWAISLMQNLARYVFDSKRWFEQNHFMGANGPIRLETDTEITAVAFVLDPELGKIDTPHGEVQFLQIVGITSDEYERIKQNAGEDGAKEFLEELKKDNPLLITDLNRR